MLLKTGSGWSVGYWGIGKEPYRLSPSLFPPFFTRSLFHCSPAFFARLHWTKAFYRLVWPGLGLKIVFLCGLVYTTNKAVSFCLIISSVHGPRASSRRGRGCGRDWEKLNASPIRTGCLQTKVEIGGSKIRQELWLFVPRVPYWRQWTKRNLPPLYWHRVPRSSICLVSINKPVKTFGN